MMKKFGKLVLFGAALSAAAAGVYYYFQNKNKKDLDEDFEEDFDSDFDDNLEDDPYDSDENPEESAASKAERTYTPLGVEKEDQFHPLEETAAKVNASQPNGKSEEFFDDDDDDPSMDAQ